MTAYFLVLAAVVVAGMLGNARVDETERRMTPALLLAALVMILFVGLRDRVGVDWLNYRWILTRAAYQDLGQALTTANPAYQLLNYLAHQLDVGMWFVNLVCAAIFVWGLFRLVACQPFPWLAVLVALPYLIIVVGMNYTRQAAALGFLMAGMASTSRGGSPWRFLALAGPAILFHSSAVLALPLATIGFKQSRVIHAALVPIVLILFFSGALTGRIDHYTSSYVEIVQQSQGAAIRLVMCVIPAALMLLAGQRMRFNENEAIMWRNASLAAIALGVSLLFLPTSTAIDRLAVYILPLQIAVIARLPFVINSYIAAKFVVVAFATSVLSVFLFFAANAYAWIPYRNYLY